MRRGEVRWAEHPDWGRRPALLMTRDEAIANLNEVFVVLATTNVRGLPTEVEVGPDDGLPQHGAFHADHTDTVAKGFLAEPITTLDSAKMAEVCRALDRATGCG